DLERVCAPCAARGVGKCNGNGVRAVPSGGNGEPANGAHREELGADEARGTADGLAAIQEAEERVKRRIVVAGGGERDLPELAGVIAMDSLAGAARFMQNIKATMEWLAGMPGAGNPVHTRLRRLAGLQSGLLPVSRTI